MSQSFPFLLKFVLQPTPQWCDKVFSEEEAVLFQFLDKKDSSLDFMSKFNKDLYLDYSVKVREICTDLGIEFYDINEMLSDSESAENWLFVDRGGHLTDQGNIAVSELIYNMDLK